MLDERGFGSGVKARLENYERQRNVKGQSIVLAV